MTNIIRAAPDVPGLCTGYLGALPVTTPMQ